MDEQKSIDIHQQPAIPPINRSGLNGGMKVIQPLSGNLEAASITVAPISPSPNSVAAASTSVEPTLINTVPTNETNYTNTKAKSANSSRSPIAIIVIILGILMAVVGGLGAIFWIGLVMTPGISAATKIEIEGISIVILLLGIGIALRREAARKVFLMVALLSLLVLGYGTFSYLKTVSKANQAKQATLKSVQSEISQMQMPNIVTSDKAQILQQLKYEKQLDERSVSVDPGATTILISGYLTTLIPLVLLTRSRVKVLFN
jgi:flagellar basal body-associated protein FliL